MKKIKLTYNPFTHERIFTVDGKTETLPKCWGEDDSKELSEWCGDFFSALKAKFNDSEMEVHFKGILRDWDFLSDAKEKYCSENPSDRISLVDAGCVNTSAKLAELRKLFDLMQSESPFPELRSPELKALFDKTMSSEFEMAVVATMSSGKSTLINSMLGCELLPARNEATTATLARIHDCDGMSGYKGKSYDKDGNELASCDPLTLANMNVLNDDPKTTNIDIYGDIPGVESKDIKLVLTDTPGPNNSRTRDHEEHTYSLLKADYKPMILYVLNGTQLETNDDNRLLKDVADDMKSGGRQSQERFLFVLNKADGFDPGKGESAQKKVEDVKRYLAAHEIYGARVFPTAALMAKVIRQYLNSQPLTEMEEDEVLPNHKSFIKREWKHFSDYAPLSIGARRILDADLAKARGEGASYREALIYTGVPAIELAISEYLAKYALPAKIAEGVHSFKSKIVSLGIESRANAKLENDEAAVSKLIKELASLSALISNGEKAKKLREKIDGFSSEKIMSSKLEKARANFQSTISGFVLKNSRTVTPKEADELNQNLSNLLGESETKFRADIMTALNKTIREQAEAAVAEYKAYLGDLVGDVTHESPDAILGATADLSVEESLNAFTKDEIVGYRKKEQEGGWGATKRVFGSIFNADWGYDDVAVHGDRVDFKTYLSSKILPKVEKFNLSTTDLVMNQAKVKEQDFKKFYKEKLAELDNKLKEKIAAKEKNLSSQEEFARMIEENKQKIAWLNAFNEKLDSVLKLND